MNRFTTLLMVCSLALALAPISIQAQDGPPTIMMSSSQCDRASIGDVFDNFRERTLPIAQDLVDEGMIGSMGILTHWWGDEWNMVTVIVAADEAAVIAANSELSSRFNELYPDDNTFITNCPRHRDAFYTGIGATDASDDDEDNGDGNAVAMSYFQCDFTRLGDIAEQDRENLGVYQEMVDEGLIRFRASMTHSWADEWNYIAITAADDIPAVLAGVAEAGERLSDDDDDTPSPLDSCTLHKDNIFRQVMWTVDP